MWPFSVAGASRPSDKQATLVQLDLRARKSIGRLAVIDRAARPGGTVFADKDGQTY